MYYPANLSSGVIYSCLLSLYGLIHVCVCVCVCLCVCVDMRGCMYNSLMFRCNTSDSVLYCMMQSLLGPVVSLFVYVRCTFACVCVGLCLCAYMCPYTCARFPVVCVRVCMRVFPCLFACACVSHARTPQACDSLVKWSSKPLLVLSSLLMNSSHMELEVEFRVVSCSSVPVNTPRRRALLLLPSNTFTHQGGGQLGVGGGNCRTSYRQT